MSSVRVSELSESVTLHPEDFFPIVDSQVITTYKTPIQSLINLAESGSASHCFFANTASFAISASSTILAAYATPVISSSYVISASYYDYIPQNFVSYSLSGSWVSASLSSSFAYTASYWSGSIAQTFASYSLSASWVTQSISASFAEVAHYISSSAYAPTASYGVPPPNTGVSPIWAWVSFSGSDLRAPLTISQASYNVRSVKWMYESVYSNWCAVNPKLWRFGFAIEFTTPLTTNKYVAWGSYYYNLKGSAAGRDTPNTLYYSQSVASSAILGFPRAVDSVDFYNAFGTLVGPISIGANDQYGCTCSVLNDAMNEHYTMPHYTDPRAWPVDNVTTKIFGTIVVFGSGSTA